MSFDKDRQSPDKIVEVRKRTTKVNIAVAIGVLLFLAVGGWVVWSVTRNPPQNPGEVSGPGVP